MTSSYKNLTENTKKSISRNAAAYTAKNYVQKNIKLKPEVAAKFDALCKEKGITAPVFIERMIEYYKNEK